MKLEKAAQVPQEELKKHSPKIRAPDSLSASVGRY